MTTCHDSQIHYHQANCMYKTSKNTVCRPRTDPQLLWSRGSLWRWIGAILNEKSAPIGAINGLIDASVGLPGDDISAKNANLLLLRKKISESEPGVTAIHLLLRAQSSCVHTATKAICYHRASPIYHHRANPPTSICHHRAKHRSASTEQITELWFATTVQVRSRNLNSPPLGNSCSH